MATRADAARRRGVARPPAMPRANERDDDDARSARAARDGATARGTMRRAPSLSDELGHYVKGFGRHDAYAGGEQIRPLMRGWVHFACVVAALTGRGLGYFKSMPERASLFVQCTMLTYLGSTCLHMVPWKTALGYDVALAMDFIGISWGFTSHSILWTGGVHSFSQFGAVAVFACMCLMQVAAFKQKNKRVLMFMRRRRLTLILLNMIFLGVVEARAIEDFKTMLAIQILSKIVSPWYFMACTRFDAKHKSFFEIQGVWGPHENWHVIILVVHLLQLKALLSQAS